MKRLFGIFEARTLLLAAVAMAVVSGYWAAVSLSKDYYVVSSPPGSVFSSEAEGLKVLYNYLEALDVPAQTLNSFEELPEGGTIVVAAQRALDRSPTAAESRALATWVEEGGRLVLAGHSAREVLRGARIGGGPAMAEETALAPRLPSIYADGVGEVFIGPERVLAEDAGWATHMKDISGQVLISRAYGRGEVVWLSSVYPLSNEGLGEADNARLATLLVASVTPVHFDEYHHGFVRGGGVWQRLGDGGRAASVIGLVALVLMLLSVSRRFGPAIEASEEPVARTGAYVESLAELYRKAGTRSSALASVEEGVRSALVRRHGSEEAGRKAHPEVASTLDSSAGLRESESITEERFVATARELARARQEVEGLDG